MKLVDGNCAGKLFNDCVPTDDLEQLDFTSKADAIDESGCVVTPVYENSTGKLVLDNSCLFKIRVIREGRDYDFKE